MRTSSARCTDASQDDADGAGPSKRKIRCRKGPEISSPVTDRQERDAISYEIPYRRIPYEVSYRRITYPRLEFKTGNLLLVLPHGCDPNVLLSRHKNWILKRAEFIEQCLSDSLNREIVGRSDAEFERLVRKLAEGISRKLEVRPNGIYLRKMTSKWASCSAKSNLTINTLLKHVPDHLVEYVVCHEVVHLKERRHNDRFWQFVSRSFRNYRELERDLFVYWFCLARKFPDEVRPGALMSQQPAVAPL